jgi:hypothetical protein
VSQVEPFELYLLGGPPERLYRRLRPEVERMPWATLDPAAHAPAAVDEARHVWTCAAFQEHRTAAACAATLQLLIASRAPLDLVVMASRFPVDEMAHVELCARLAGALGGPVALVHDPDDMVVRPPAEHSPTLRCAELVVRTFCVGEAVSIPLLRESARRAAHPLVRAVLARIAKDEAAHGRFGWIYLDWVDERLSPDDREVLRLAALDEMGKLERTWENLMRRAHERGAGESLGWLPMATYIPSAYRALERVVRRPLAERGLYRAAAR